MGTREQYKRMMDDVDREKDRTKKLPEPNTQITVSMGPRTLDFWRKMMDEYNESHERLHSIIDKHNALIDKHRK